MLYKCKDYQKNCIAFGNYKIDDDDLNYFKFKKKNYL